MKVDCLSVIVIYDSDDILIVVIKERLDEASLPAFLFAIHDNWFFVVKQV